MALPSRNRRKTKRKGGECQRHVLHKYIHKDTYMYKYIYVCVCVCIKRLYHMGGVCID